MKTTVARSRGEALNHLYKLLAIGAVMLDVTDDDPEVVSAYWRQVRHDLYVLGVAPLELQDSDIPTEEAR